jgi:hypothetical protein
MGVKRLLVSLDDETYDALRKLAFEKNTQMAKLVRHAIWETFEDDLDNILGEIALEEHLRDPSGSVTIDELLEKYRIELPGRPQSNSRASVRPRRKSRPQARRTRTRTA